MSDEWNWGQDPKETDDAAQQSAPEEDLNENVTYHYKYTSSRNGGNTGNPDNGNYYASGRNYQNTSGNTTGDTAGSNIGNEAGEPSSEPKYAHYQVDEQEKKTEEESKRRHHRHQTDGKPESGFGKKAGNTITLAVLFGLVAGLVFQAVNEIGRASCRERV